MAVMFSFFPQILSKKDSLLCLLISLTLIFGSCKKDNNTPQQDEGKQTEEFYLKYKADGVWITETDVSAKRGTSDNPRTLTLLGSAKGGANPKFKFTTTESFIGFEAGLNVGCDINSAGTDEVEFTNSAGLLHTSIISNNKMNVGFLRLSYTKGGIAYGVFSGKVQAESGNIVTITEGKFNLKFAD